jgi:hypothetical protein
MRAGTGNQAHGRRSTLRSLFAGLDKDKLRTNFTGRKFGDMEGCQMPFSQHHIDPAHIEAMRAAFYRVCDALLLKGDVEDPMTEIIVNKIIALAKAGEYDADQLAAGVLNDLANDAAA